MAFSNDQMWMESTKSIIFLSITCISAWVYNTATKNTFFWLLIFKATKIELIFMGLLASNGYVIILFKAKIV